jgi:MFS family permease
MVGMILYGVLRLMLQVCALPFIVLNAKKETHSEAISLYFQTFSISVFASGLINYILASLAPDFFTEKLMLQIFALLALFGTFFVFSIKIKEPLSEKVSLRNVLTSYDWRLILNAIIPTILIAVGAGFTIPFINLFFQSVHGIDSRYFSIIGSFSFVLVAAMLLFIPFIQRHYGYRTAIVTFQGLAVLALFVMASTEWYSTYSFAMPIAVIAYLLRQPLMNVAGPSTSELSLNYVGERNQEILSALQAAVWSGSWFISSLLFGWMRNLDISYVNIFMITVVLYIIATVWYLRLISAFEILKKR